MFTNNINSFFVYLLFLCSLFLLFIGGPDYYSSRSFKNIWDLGHVLIFYIGTYILLKKTSFLYNKNILKQAIWIFGLTVIFGLLIEVFQTFTTSRTADITDFFRDILGSGIAFIFFSNRKKTLKNFKNLIIHAVTVISLIIVIIPALISLYDEFLAEKQMPLLSGFETPFEIERWEETTYKEISNEFVHTGSYSLKTKLDTLKYSGIYLKYFPENWSLYSTLNFYLYNDSNSDFYLNCRIHDFQHILNDQPYSDRYNSGFNALPGWNHFSIDLNEVKNAPAERDMDMKKIRSLAFFITELSEPKIIYIDNVYLN